MMVARKKSTHAPAASNLDEVAERLQRRAERDAADAEAPKQRTAEEQRTFKPSHVDNPYGYGVDRVPRVVDTIEAMHKRHQISQEERDAAMTYRNAHDISLGANGKEIDFDNVSSGGGGPGKTLPELTLAAAQKLNEADKWLGKIDGMVVKLVAGDNLSLAEVAGILGIARPGDRLREALALLASRWHPTVSGSGSNIRSSTRKLSADERRAAMKKSAAGPIATGKWAHATGRKVFHGKTR